MTLIGAMAQQNAETLGGIMLTQTVSKNLPTMYCGRVCFMNPRSGRDLWGLPEEGLVSAAMVQRFARRLAGDRGDGVIRLAAMAIRGVALGVVVTALIQSVLGGIGLAIAGIPFATLLTAVMFMLAIAQLGPLLVLAPAVGWLYWQGDSGPATVLLVWTIVVGSLDNFLRPFLIKKGADLPLLLIFAGVIGGLIAFGLVGIFVGPVVLAITYTLLEAWIADETPQSGDTGAGPASDLRSPP